MLKDTIRKEFMESRRTGDTVKKNSLEAVVAGILVKEKSGKGEITDVDVIDCINKEIKAQQEIVETTKERYPDRTIEAEKRIACLYTFLPAQLSEDEVLSIIKNADVFSDNTPKTKGMIIKAIMPELIGKFDKAFINPLVEKYLNAKYN